MADALVNFIKSHVEYLELNIAMNREQATMDALETEAFKSIVAAMRRVTDVEVSSANTIGKVLKNSSAIIDCHKNLILAEMDARLSHKFLEASGGSEETPPPCKSAAAKMQTCLHFHHLMTESLWRRLENVDVSLECCLLHLAAHAKALGINHPSERTVANIVSIIVAIKQLRFGISVDTQTRLLAGRKFKSTLRCLPLPYDGPKDYPDSACTLK